MNHCLPCTPPVHVGHYRSRRTREFLDFINQLVTKNPDKDIHVVLDNPNTPKPKQLGPREKR